MNNVKLFSGISTWCPLTHVLLVFMPYVPGSTQLLRVNDRMPGHATHLSKEVGQDHVWKGLGPSGNLGRTKTGGIRKQACAVVRRGQPNPTALGVPWHSGLSKPH